MISTTNTDDISNIRQLRAYPNETDTILGM